MTARCHYGLLTLCYAPQQVSKSKQRARWVHRVRLKWNAMTNLSVDIAEIYRLLISSPCQNLVGWAASPPMYPHTLTNMSQLLELFRRQTNPQRQNTASLAEGKTDGIKSEQHRTNRLEDVENRLNRTMPRCTSLREVASCIYIGDPDGGQLLPVAGQGVQLSRCAESLVSARDLRQAIT